MIFRNLYKPVLTRVRRNNRYTTKIVHINYFIMMLYMVIKTRHNVKTSGNDMKQKKKKKKKLEICRTVPVAEVGIIKVRPIILFIIFLLAFLLFV